MTRKGEVLLCGTCVDARSIADAEVAEGTHRGTLDELAERAFVAEPVLAF